MPLPRLHELLATGVFVPRGLRQRQAAATPMAVAMPRPPGRDPACRESDPFDFSRRPVESGGLRHVQTTQTMAMAMAKGMVKDTAKDRVQVRLLDADDGRALPAWI